MKDIYWRIVLFVCLFLSTNLSSQDYKGLRIGPFAGINGTFSNPAYARTSATSWDLNLISTGTDLSNNYFHFNNTSAIGLLNRRQDLINKIETGVDNADQIAETFNISYSDKNNTRAHFQSEVVGPSFILHLNKWSIGVYNKASILFHMNDFPNFNLSNGIADLGFNEEFDFPEGDFSILSLAEAGLSISRTIEAGNYSYLHIGSNLKLYRAYDLISASSEISSTASKLENAVHFDDAEFEAAYFSGLSIDTETNQTTYSPTQKGTGAGIDIGFIYEMKQSNFDNGGLKLGVSFHDLGFINFSDGYFHHFTIDDGIISNAEFLDESYTAELLKELDIADKNYIEVAQVKRIATPATVNFLVEYAYSSNLLFNVTVRENLPTGSPVEKASFLSASAQYNKKWLGVTVPLSLYNHEVLRLGTGVRLGPLTLGTDNIIPLLLPVNLRAINFYMGLSLNSSMFNFRKRDKGSYRKEKSKNGNTKNVKCYYFD